jgi:hypothetical protein
MASSGMLRRLALVRADVSAARIDELVTASLVPSSPLLATLMRKALSYSETSVVTRATQCNIPEDAIFIVTAVKT